MQEGIYEQLINQMIHEEIKRLPIENYHLASEVLPRKQAAFLLSQYFSRILKKALGYLKDQDKDKTAFQQIELANKLIKVLANELENQGIEENLIVTEGKILKAVIKKLNFPYPKIEEHIQSLYPLSGLSESELFTGNKSGISLESEIRKEIQSADEIQWIVSFVKYSGIRIFLKDLEEHTRKGRVFKLITTTYMGATDPKAIEALANLPNTEIKISYNNSQERLHAKAYLFLRNTLFHTGYIGSSNISRTALTSGLEWNLKVTTQEIPHIIDKFQKTFDTYWNDFEFEKYEPKDEGKLRNAILSARGKQNEQKAEVYFDLKPFPFQQEILDRLEIERTQGNYKNLIVAATGTGKTVVAAFDFKKIYKKNPAAKLLFVAHREEILHHALATFRHVLKEQNFGDTWLAGKEPNNYQYVFASVQTLANRIPSLKLDASFYDYIVVDEVHHISADSYRPILANFRPTYLIGLTATPERMDNRDILLDFSNVISAELRLPEALNRKLLCPFHYFGVTDSVDISKVSWSKGRYEKEGLEKIYTEDDRRCSNIYEVCKKYLTDIHDVCCLGFCVSIKHANFMADRFSEYKLKAAALTSQNKQERAELFHKLKTKQINFLFVVDIFNEGIDIPEIDTVLFLRPTESLTIFLQQLGRGLRLNEDKDCLTVLDFVGNSHPEYDFLHKFRGMIGKTSLALKNEIEHDFPHLPLGCSIVLEKRAREIILQNIEQASRSGLSRLKRKIREFNQNSTLPLTLSNFMSVENYSLYDIYCKKNPWYKLMEITGMSKAVKPDVFNTEIILLLRSTWLSTDSASYFKNIIKILNNTFDNSMTHSKFIYLMLFYDIFGQSPKKLKYNSALHGIQDVLTHDHIKEELFDYLNERIRYCECIEKDDVSDALFPLRLHGRYTRNQILVAIGLNTEAKKSSNIEGVAENKELKVEALFVTLDKSKGHYSSSTMYEDYALKEDLFHWQSQNATRPESPKGLSYINHKKLGKKILLFVRERQKNENGIFMAYVYLGPVEIVSYSGSQPMSIIWRLYNDMPPILFNDSRKLAVG